MAGSIHLALKFEPTPENAPRLADLIIRPARELSGVTLDYTPRSLPHVDEIVSGFAKGGARLDEIAETLYSFGCYLGEVVVRNTGATWRFAHETKMKDVAGYGLVVQFTEDDLCNPIAKVFKLFEHGAQDSVAYFYAVFAKKHELQKSPGILRRLFRRKANTDA